MSVPMSEFPHLMFWCKLGSARSSKSLSCFETFSWLSSSSTFSNKESLATSACARTSTSKMLCREEPLARQRPFQSLLSGMHPVRCTDRESIPNSSSQFWIVRKEHRTYDVATFQRQPPSCGYTVQVPSREFVCPEQRNPIHAGSTTGIFPLLSFCPTVPQLAEYNPRYTRSNRPCWPFSPPAVPTLAWWPF